jgi:RNA polymerase sigma-70 factor (ECF subfamily)
VQDSFHKVFLHLGKFQEKSKFSTWLTRIVMNEAFILLRRRRGVSEPLLTESPDNDAKSPSDLLLDRGPSPEQSCWQRERTKLLAEAINHLGPKIRRTVLLCNIEERSIEETAQILGTSRGAVKSRLFQGYKKLRRTLNPRLLRGVNAVSRAEAHRTFVGNVAF